LFLASQPVNHPIHFHKENVHFRLTKQEELKKWIASAIKSYGYSMQVINYIFCSDKYLLKINQQYLKHNYFTDIITFNNSSEEKKLEADIFISIDRVKANAVQYKTTFNDELHRVMIHGALHLVGFDDKKSSKQAEMSMEEDKWLARWNF
jgi:probable rRNA maturation factor